MKKWVPIVVTLSLLLNSGSALASTMTATQNLFFGTWVPTTSSGSVTVTTSGTTSSSGVTAAPSGAASYQAILRFSGTGLGTLLDIITVTPLSSSVTLSNGSGGTVTVGSFVPQTGLGVNLLSPNVNIPMGGTLTFSGTPSGTYTGSVQVQGTGLLSGSATATVPISVVFWKTLTVTEQTRLNFGAMEVLSGNSVVRVAAQTGARSIISGAGNVNLLSSPSPAAGSFSISGQNSKAVTVTLPTSATLTGSGGGTMSMNNFTNFPTSTTLNPGGNLTLKVGADLAIGTNQAAGTYTGTYNVTINY